MRKIISIFLLLLLLAGCSRQPTETTAPSNTTAPSIPAVTDPSETAPTVSVPPETEPTVPPVEVSRMEVSSEEDQLAKDAATLLFSQAMADYAILADCPVYWCGKDSADTLKEGQKAVWVQELPKHAPYPSHSGNRGRIMAIYLYYPCAFDPSLADDAALTEHNVVRVFGYLGIPQSASGTVPGMIYVHGGAGHASAGAVIEVMNHGYAAIALDTEGTYNITGGNSFSDSGRFFADDPFGHIPNDNFESYQLPLQDQWMYWAVGDTILANTLLRSLENVEQVGVVGMSWGGIIASNVICFDYRFDFCVPVYCSFGEEFNYGYDGQKLKEKPEARYLWHNRDFLAESPVPTLLLCGDDDLYCSVNCNVLSYEALQNGTLIIKHHYDHSHQHGVSSAEVYRYTDYLLGRSESFIQPDRQPTAEDGYTYTLSLQIPSDITNPEVELHYMPYAIRKYNNSNSLPKWSSVTLPYDAETGTVTVTVPEKAYMYFLTFTGHCEEVGAVRRMSPYQEYCNYAHDALISSTNIVLLQGDTIQHLYKK